MSKLASKSQNLRFPVPTVRITVGEPVPEYPWQDIEGSPYSLYTDSHCGKPTVLIVCRRVADATQVIGRFNDLYRSFQELGAEVVVVTAAAAKENATVTVMMGLSLPILSDAEFAIGHAAGLESAKGCRIFLLSANMRVERALDGAAAGDAAVMALDHIRAGRAALPPQLVVSHPPVLVLPNVLPVKLCNDIIALFEQSNRYAGRVTNKDASYVVAPVKVRQDAVCPDNSPEAQAMFAQFRRRVFPEMYKAFKSRVTRIETMRIGCYEASSGGRFAPHRDENAPRVKYRRFGFSINLNAGEYDGGYLTFPEYGPQLYAMGTGDIVVFSASLLHAATPVIKGKRYGIFGFFFNEDDEAWRHKVNPAVEATIVDDPDGSYHVGRGSEPLPDPSTVV